MIVGDQIAATITAKALEDRVADTGDTLTGLLQFSGTDHAGIKLNSLTTTQRDALSASAGMLIYNSTLSAVQKYAASWESLESRAYTKIVAPSGTAADYNTDGTGDDVEIQAAVDAVNSAGGGTVRLRNGTYTISSTITLPSNIVLEGEGSKTIIFAANAMGNASNMITNTDFTSGNTAIVIRNLAVDGNFQNRGALISDETGNNIMFKKVTNSLISHVWAYNGTMDNIALVQGCTDNVIANCVVYNAADHNILLLGTSSGTECKRNVVANNVAYGAGANSVNGVNIELAKYATENVIVGNDSRSALEGGIHVFYRSNRNVIVGNTLVSNGQQGISIVDESDSNLISNNIIRSSGRNGISATTAFLTYGGYYNSIVNNYITGCGYNGINGTLIGSNVSGNIVDSCGASGTSNQQYGIYIFSANTAIIAGNRVTNSTSRGMEIDNAARCLITNNYVGSNGAHGMFFDAASSMTDCEISNNILDTNPGAGIILFRNATRCVIANNVIKTSSGGNSGIDLRGVTHSTITGNSCIANTYGIRLQNDANSVGCTYNVVSGNTCYLNGSGGINESGAADHNIYVGNNCNGNTASNFSTVGASNQIGLNITT